MRRHMEPFQLKAETVTSPIALCTVSGIPDRSQEPNKSKYNKPSSKSFRVDLEPQTL
jgi:hypothetical protein